MLRLDNVCKHFGQQTAVQPLTLELPEAETTAILGPSGCGKSTLLRMIVGLLEPDQGSIWFDGQVITPENVLRLRRRMGYVIQQGGLFPHLTVEQNVTLMARHLQWQPDQMEQRIAELLTLTSLPFDLLARYPQQVSGGQRQRVSLMRALFLDPDVLLLDEPLGALDPMIRSQLQVDLRKIFRSLKKTVVLVTHDIGEAAYLGDTLMLMRQGGIEQRGSLQHLVRNPASEFVRAFINAQRSPLESLQGDEDA